MRHEVQRAIEPRTSAEKVYIFYLQTQSGCAVWACGDAYLADAYPLHGHSLGRVVVGGRDSGAGSRWCGW